MTVSQLYNSVAQLGFEDSLESEKSFIYATNRALLQVNALRPAKGTCLVNHRPIKNRASKATFEPVEKTDELIYTAYNVKAYYFEVDGNGTMYIEKYDENSWTTIGTVEFSGAQSFTAYRGFIKQDGNFIDDYVRLRFTGEYLYSVKCVAMYEHLYSERVGDIPAYEPFTRYDISLLASDFLSLATPPIVETDGLTYLNQDYTVENGRVVLFPYDMKGVYKVIYNRLPKSVEYKGNASEDTTVIDLDEDLCALLPNLIASYVWMDDEPEKAQYYLMLYRESAADIERRIVNLTPIPIKSSNGW